MPDGLIHHWAGALPGQGDGFVRRLQGIARYEERDGGVYVELERLSRSTLATSLRQTFEGVSASDHGPQAVTLCGAHGFTPENRTYSADY